MKILSNSINKYTQFALEELMEVYFSGRTNKSYQCSCWTTSVTTSRMHDPQGFKEEIRNKFDTVKEVVEKFPKGTRVMMELLKA